MVKACSYPWIEPYINSYAGNNTAFTGTSFRKCCLAPGQCPEAFEGVCPFGYLDCRVGNSKYVCQFSNTASANMTSCYTEGYLASLRSKPCCPPMLGDLLKTRTCLQGTGSSYDSTVCCPKGAGSCELVLGCVGYQSFTGYLGLKWGIYTGSAGSPLGMSDCVEEVALGAEKTANCYSVNSSSCNLGPPPPPPVTTTTTALLPTSPATSTPSGSSSVTGPGAVTPTNKGSEGVSLVGRGRTTVKKAALVLFVPMILQLVLT